MTPVKEPNANGGALLAVIDSKVDEVLRRLNCIDEQQQRQDVRLTNLEISDRGQDERLESVEDETKGLRSRDTWSGLVGILAAAIAGAIAYLKP
jgi:hypothetical protein